MRRTTIARTTSLVAGLGMILALLTTSLAARPGQDAKPNTAAGIIDPRSQEPAAAGHPAVGSWFGKAIQVCQAGVAPSACANGQPASTLFMTPTLTTDGLFIADDSFTMLGPPFGPHATAHGTWVPTNSTEFTAEYVFMTNPYPPVANSITGVRARWVARIVDENTAVGWVNAYFLTPTPISWTRLLEDEYPVFPAEAAGFVTPPTVFIKDPALCRTAGCPQVFKFTLKRITK